VVGVGEGRKNVGANGSMAILTYTKNATTKISINTLNGLERRFRWRIFHRRPLISICQSYHLRGTSVKKLFLYLLP
jgi:hypothetical protein